MMGAPDVYTMDSAAPTCDQAAAFNTPRVTWLLVHL